MRCFRSAGEGVVDGDEVGAVRVLRLARQLRIRHDARHRIVILDHAPQAGTDDLQQLIAHGIAEQLVDGLKAIEAEVKKDSAVVISGASGAEPATSEERKVLSEIALPVRATATHIGNGMEAQFLANIALGCQAVRKGTLFPGSGSGDTGNAPAGGIRQAVVTSVGHWRGEGLALVEKID